MPPAIGDQVRIKRDEARYPSRGTWPRFRGKTGTVAQINTDRRRPELTEYGVVSCKVYRRANGTFCWDFDSHPVTWFKGYELQSSATAPQRAARRGFSAPEGASARVRVSQELARV